MHLNPEFKRNLYFNQGIHRLLVYPLIVSSLLFLLFLFSRHSPDYLLAPACLLFLLIVFFVSTRDVADSIIDEVRQGTWDFQRMSAMSAWQMVIGKMFGAPFYSLLLASLPMLVVIISLFSSGHENTWSIIILMLLIAVAGLASAMLMTLFLRLKNPQSNPRTTHILLFLFSLWIIGYCYNLLTMVEPQAIIWYQQSFKALPFILFSTLFFVINLLLACYRLMRLELHYHNSPLYWFLFVVVQLLYWNGFILEFSFFDLTESTLRSLQTFILSLMFCWLAIYANLNNSTDYYRLWHNFKQRKWTEMMVYLPIPLVSLLLCWGCALIMSLVISQSGLFLLIMSIFIARDVFLSVFFVLFRGGGKADASILFSLLMLYLMIPMMLNELGLQSLLFIFLPLSFNQQNDFLLILAPLLQLAMVMLLIRWRIVHAACK